MRTWLGWVFLFAVLFVTFIGPLIGIHHAAGFNDPINFTDLFIWGTTTIAIIILEVREAATWVVEHIAEKPYKDPPRYR